VKRHLNTLFVTTPGAYLAKEGETVLVRKEGELLLRLPLLNLAGIVCFGHVGCSPALMGLCGERGVALTFLSEHGRFLARVVGSTPGNVLLRREQYRRADDAAATLSIVRAIVAAKIVNARSVLLRAARERDEPAGAATLQTTAAHLSALLGELSRVDSVDSARGLEGVAARDYFGAFPALILLRDEQEKEAFTFRGRSRRPPLDRINALMSFVYTLLLHDTTAALESSGLDPAVGFLHRDRPGRDGLALDVMEEFRPWLADRLALSLVNLRQITAADFRIGETGAVTLTDDGRKCVLVAWQKRKQDEVTHPFLEEKTTIGLLPALQALLLARHLRGDLDAYPPFVWK
jgi:CRISPR-associated protein Cas1